MPIDLLAERPFPPSGGTLAVGEESWTFAEAYLFAWEMPPIGAGSDAYNLTLHDEERGASLNFLYDIESHRTSLASVSVGAETVPVDEGACALDRSNLGQTNPRTVVFELAIECPGIEVPGMGPVPVSGTVVVDELAWPEL